MSLTNDLTKLANSANVLVNSITVNSTAITSIAVGGASLNATTFDGTANNANYLGGTAAAGYQTTAGLSANVATLSANASTYLNGKTESNLNVNSALTSNSASYLGGNTASDLRTYSDTAAATAYSNGTSYADTKAATAYSNATSYADTKAGAAYSNAIAYSGNAAQAYSNATSYADTKAATAYSNATSYADTKAATAYSNATSYADTKAATAYTNATSYVDGKSYVNTSQLSTNLSNYAALSGATFTGAVTVSNNFTVTGNLTLSGNTVIVGANNLVVQDAVVSLHTPANLSPLTSNDGKNIGLAFHYYDTEDRHALLYRDNSTGYLQYHTDGGDPISNSNPTGNSLGTIQAARFWAGNDSVYSTVNATAYSGTANNSSYLGGTIASGYQTTAGLSANVATLTANNANNLGGVAAASYVNTSGSYTITGVHTHNANVVFGTSAGISANGGYGTSGQVLTSNGSAVYWATAAAGVNTSAQYTWSNTQTFSNTITFSSTINGTANNTLYLGGTAAAGYQTTAGLSANVATLAANSSTYANSSVTNTFTVGTASWFVSNGSFYVGSSTGFGEKFLVKSTTLDTGVGNTVLTASYWTPDTNNTTRLLIQDYRFSIGNSHTTSRTLIQRRVDSTSMGYLGFDSSATSIGWGTTEAMRIDSSGNVLINTTTADALLTIGGNSANTVNALLATGVSDPSFKLRVKNGVSGTGVVQAKLTMDYGSSYNDLAGIWFLRGGGANGELAFYTGSSANGSERMRIDSSGNVGIGTSTFNGVRTVVQGAQTGGAPQTSGTTQTYGLLRLRGTTFTSVLDFGTNGGDYNWIQATDSSNLATNYSLALNPNGGNVGIGTASPSAKLQIQGSQASGTANVLYLDNSSTTGTTLASVSFSNAGAVKASIAACVAGDGYMTFNNNNNSEKMRINASGNMGIGTTTIPYKLVVTGDTNTGIAGFLGNNNGSLPGTNGDATLVIGSNYSAGSAEANYFHNDSTYSGTNGGHRFLQRTGASTAADLLWVTQNLSRFYTGGSERMRIDSSGRIGFGVTPSTGASFQVKAIASGTADGRVEINKYLGTAASPSESQDWPSPALGIRTFQDFAKDTMLSFGYSNDAYYKTDDSVWNFRLNGLANATTSSSSTHLDLGGPGVFFINSSYTQSTGSLRAPIFYDSNDTAYYCDPNSVSRFYGLSHVGGTAYFQGGRGVDQCCGDDGAISVGGDATKPPRIAWHSSGIMEGTIEGSGTGWRKIYFYDQQGSGLGVHATGQIASNQNVVAYYSDRRLKEDFEQVTDHWNVINNLTGYRFTWNEKAGEIPGFINNVGKREVGLIAQEVNAVYPEAVYTRQEGPAEDPYKTILHDRFTPVFVEALKDLKREIELLKEENAKLRELIK